MEDFHADQEGDAFPPSLPEKQEEIDQIFSEVKQALNQIIIHIFPFARWNDLQLNFFIETHSHNHSAATVHMTLSWNKMGLRLVRLNPETIANSLNHQTRQTRRIIATILVNNWLTEAMHAYSEEDSDTDEENPGRNWKHWNKREKNEDEDWQYEEDDWEQDEEDDWEEDEEDDWEEDEEDWKVAYRRNELLEQYPVIRTVFDAIVKGQLPSSATVDVDEEETL